MSHIAARSLAILALLVFAASVTGGACSRGKYTKVTRTDGSTVIGTLVSIQPDVVVLQTRGGRIEIRRSDVASLEVPTISEITALQGGQATGNAASGPGTAGAGSSGTPGSGGTQAQASSEPQGPASSGEPQGPASSGAHASNGTPPGARGNDDSGRTGTQAPRGASGGGLPGGGAYGTSGAGTSGTAKSAGAAAAAGASPNDTVTNDGVTVATIPAGTALTVTFDTPLGSDTSRVEDAVVATVKSAIAVGGTRIVPAGALLRGRVTEATPARAAGGRGRLAIRFHTLVIGARTMPIDAPAAAVAAVFTREDKKKVGIGAATGAVLGGIVSRTKKGLGIGAAAGAGGTAAAVGIRNDVRVARGAALRLQLSQPVSVPIP